MAATGESRLVALMILVLLTISGCSAYGGNKYAASTGYGTPVMMAEAGKGNTRYVTILLSDGSDPNETGTDPATLRLIEGYVRDEQWAGLLLGEDVEWSPFMDTNMTPLMAAITAGSGDTARLLLKMRANPNVKTARGFTPLTICALAENPRLLNILLDGGAKINSKTRGGATALMIATMNDDRIIAQTLISRGADIDAATRSGETPLLLAIRQGKTEMAQFLLECNADPNARDKSGTTPLMAAAQAGNIKIVEALLAKGAEVKRKNKEGSTALAIAQENKVKPEVVEALEKAELVE